MGRGLFLSSLFTQQKKTGLSREPFRAGTSWCGLKISWCWLPKWWWLSPSPLCFVFPFSKQTDTRFTFLKHTSSILPASHLCFENQALHGGDTTHHMPAVAMPGARRWFSFEIRFLTNIMDSYLTLLSLWVDYQVYQTFSRHHGPLRTWYCQSLCYHIIHWNPEVQEILKYKEIQLISSRFRRWACSVFPR